jgi:hypothetical protein
MNECEYEFYTIHASSLTDDTLVSGNTFTNYLFNSIKDVVEVNVLVADFDARSSGSNVCYLNVDELSSRFNDITGNSSISANPSTRSQITNPVAIFVVDSTGRTTYKEIDYVSKTYYYTPIRKIDRLTIRLRDSNGNLIPLDSNDVHISFSFKCKRTNMCY